MTSKDEGEKALRWRPMISGKQWQSTVLTRQSEGEGGLLKNEGRKGKGKRREKEERGDRTYLSLINFIQ